ncbi:MAG: DUF5343 domain-containing protein [Erysipelotrichaceae bacterium]|nr:DUF5343 domain-containing protein [Erysipelotrichaceae bacterium]
MTGSFTKIPEYFETMLTAKAPEKFTIKFLSDLGFSSSSDRQFVNVLKSIGFLDELGTPTSRYFNFLDQSKSKSMVAEGVKIAYADLFAINTQANKLSKVEVEGKFKTMTNGSKENKTISYMASTFLNLCAYAEWNESHEKIVKHENKPTETTSQITIKDEMEHKKSSTGIFDLNYNIHIHLPATRDESVYDALFASLAKHFPIK